MKIVNGFVCDCRDEERLAKKGVDPANPREDPVIERELEEKSGIPSETPLEELQEAALDPNRRTKEPFGAAVTFGGALSKVSVEESAQNPSPALDLHV